MKEGTKQQALKHYNRMIKYARSMEPKGKISWRKMEKEIGESWFSGNCSYCENYSCDLCKLQEEAGCCDGLWTKMNRAKTWDEFVKRAIAVREYIKENG